jgi:hypothetical protein
MNTNQQKNIPAKGDIIINPLTQRPIRVGGRSWLKLVKEGTVSGHYTDPKKLATLGDDPEGQIEELNKSLPRGKQAVRGRGRYKGQIITRNKQPDTEEVSRYTAQMASRVVNENIESLADCDDIEAELERLILQEMAGGKTKKKVGRPKKTTEDEKYVLQEPELYDEHDLDDEDEDELHYKEEPNHSNHFQADESFFDDDIDYFENE